LILHVQPPTWSGYQWVGFDVLRKLLFLDTLCEHNSVKRIKIKSRPNLFITPEIKQLMKIRDGWRKGGVKQTTMASCSAGTIKKGRLLISHMWIARLFNQVLWQTRTRKRSRRVAEGIKVWRDNLLLESCNLSTPRVKRLNYSFKQLPKIDLIWAVVV